MYKVESLFIETPAKKLFKVEADTTIEGAGLVDIEEALYRGGRFDGSVRVEIKVYQDQAQEIDRQKIEEQFKLSGASEVDIRIIRVPRETVRSTEVTKAVGLPEKVSILAKTRGEEVPDGVLAKAEMLEALPAEQILERVGGVA